MPTPASQTAKNRACSRSLASLGAFRTPVPICVNVIQIYSIISRVYSLQVLRDIGSRSQRWSGRNPWRIQRILGDERITCRLSIPTRDEIIWGSVPVWASKLGSQWVVDPSQQEEKSHVAPRGKLSLSEPESHIAESSVAVSLPSEASTMSRSRLWACKHFWKCTAKRRTFVTARLQNLHVNALLEIRRDFESLLWRSLFLFFLSRCGMTILLTN